MITYSGTRIEPTTKFNGDFSGVPGLTDIALGLGRMPRFAGQTRRWWPVLLHALVCVEIANRMTFNKCVQFYALMHDAHEAITADVPAFFKPKELKEQQDAIDSRMYTHLGVGVPNLYQAVAISVLDEAALRAEAFVLGPPAIMAHLSEPHKWDVEIVHDIAEQFPSPLDTDGIDSPGAREFLAVFAQLHPHAVTSRRDDSPATFNKEKA